MWRWSYQLNLMITLCSISFENGKYNVILPSIFLKASYYIKLIYSIILEYCMHWLSIYSEVLVQKYLNVVF